MRRKDNALELLGEEERRSIVRGMLLDSSLDIAITDESHESHWVGLLPRQRY